MNVFLTDFLTENFAHGSHILVVSVSRDLTFEKIKNLFHFTFLQADPHKEDITDSVPLVSGLYDGIVVIDWLEHCLWKRWAIQKFHYLLNDNGKLVIYTQSQNLFSFLTQVISGGKRTGIAGDLTCGLFHVPRPLDLRNAVKSQGFLIHCQILFCFFFRVFGLYSQYENLTRIQQLFNKIKAGLALLCGRSVLLSCQKKTIRQDLTVPLSQTEIHQQVGAFEQACRTYLADRQKWLAQNPSYADQDCVPFDPAQYRHQWVLIFSPHPDDEVIGCGGLIQRLVQSGAKVVIVQVTDGTDSRVFRTCPGKVDRRVRLEESRQVAQGLRVNQGILWEYPETSLSQVEDAAEKCIHVLQKYRPSLIGIPFVNDPHPVHQAVHHSLKAALPKIQETWQETSILQYEVWSLVPPNTYCIFDDLFPTKCDLLMQYQTGMKGFDYVTFCRQRNSYESLHLLNRRGYVECFLKVTVPEYLQLNPIDTQEAGQERHENRGDSQ
jgi:LmbE family N-acetylglucosaminyl deacetylase